MLLYGKSYALSKEKLCFGYGKDMLYAKKSYPFGRQKDSFSMVENVCLQVYRLHEFDGIDVLCYALGNFLGILHGMD